MKTNRNICIILIMGLVFSPAAHAQASPPVAIAPVPANNETLMGRLKQAPDTTGGQPSVAASQVFSYGNSNISILFLPDQVSHMKEAISAFEGDSKNSRPAMFAQPQAKVIVAPESTVVDPSVYPVFFLSSIVYNTPKDWSIWIGGAKITSRKNETELTVLTVTPDSATFLWKPAYADAIGQRKQGDAFASVDGVKNKLSTQQRITFDKQNGGVTFTLRQNQSFAVGYFKLFEGYVDSPKMEPMKVATEAMVPIAPTEPETSLSQPASPRDRIMPAASMPPRI